jgi:O-antigen/teichoic acid export membrane protein
VPILQTIALLPVITGLEPLFVTLAQRELNFRKAIQLQVSASLSGLVVGVVLAYLRPDAWCLVISNLTVALVTSLGAYAMSRRDHLGFSWNLRPLKHLWQYSAWIMLSTTLSYAFAKGGDWVVGRMLDVRSLAVYQMAYLLCTTITYELGGVFSKLTLPLFSRMQTDTLRLKRVFTKIFGLIALLTFGVVALLVSCSDDLVMLLLGGDWVDLLPLVPWLAVWGVCGMFAGPQSALFNAVGKPRLWTKTISYMTLMLLVGLAPMTSMYGALGVAILLGGIGVIRQLYRYHMISRELSISYFEVFRQVVLPMTGALASIMVAQQLRGNLPGDANWQGLSISVVAVVSIYGLSILLMGRWLEVSPKDVFGQLLARKSPSKN